MEKIKVLIADDSTVVLEVLSSYLQDKEDIEVVGTAEDGLQVMDILRSKPVDVLLLDMVMPRLDGFGWHRSKRRICRTARTSSPSRR